MPRAAVALQCLSLTLLLLSAAFGAEQRALRFSVSASWAMPMVHFVDGQATDGILYDLQHRLAEKIRRRAELLVGRHEQRLQVNQLDDESIGTVLGFTYPKLEPLFSRGQLQRDNARTQQLALAEVASEPLACSVRDEPDVPSMALLRALVQMQRDGEFEAILVRYR